jgi:hypothetical protein
VTGQNNITPQKIGRILQAVKPKKMQGVEAFYQITLIRQYREAKMPSSNAVLQCLEQSAE